MVTLCWDSGTDNHLLLWDLRPHGLTGDELPKNIKKEEVGKKNEKNAKLPLLLWKKRWIFGISHSSQLSCNLGFAPGSKVEKICGSAEVDDSHGFMADLTPLCSLHSKLATQVTKWDPDLLTSTTTTTTTTTRRRRRRRRSLSGFLLITLITSEFSLWVFQRIEVKQLRSHWTAMRCMAMHRLWAQEVSVSEHQPWPPEDAPRRTHETSWKTPSDTCANFLGFYDQILTHVNCEIPW